MTKQILKTIIISSLFIPFLANAQSTTTQATSTATTTQAQVMNAFNACVKTAIDKRESAITSAKGAYASTTASLLSARKDAEAKALLLTDETAKKEALKKAKETYRTGMKQAQNTLKTGRETIWKTFETEKSKCVGEKKTWLQKLFSFKKDEIKEMRKEVKEERKEHREDERERREDKKEHRDELRNGTSTGR